MVYKILVGHRASERGSIHRTLRAQLSLPHIRRILYRVLLRPNPAILSASKLWAGHVIDAQGHSASAIDREDLPRDEGRVVRAEESRAMLRSRGPAVAGSRRQSSLSLVLWDALLLRIWIRAKKAWCYGVDVDPGWAELECLTCRPGQKDKACMKEKPGIEKQNLSNLPTASWANLHAWPSCSLDPSQARL